MKDYIIYNGAPRPIHGPYTARDAARIADELERIGVEITVDRLRHFPDENLEPDVSLDVRDPFHRGIQPS